MIVYHVSASAEAVLVEGFRDPVNRHLVGVWLSEVSLLDEPDIKGDTLLTVDIPEGILQPFEQFTHDYRIFVVPAAVVNAYGPPRVENHLFAGCTREDLLRSAASYERSGRVAMANQIRQSTIAFLARHGLLGVSTVE